MHCTDSKIHLTLTDFSNHLKCFKILKYFNYVTPVIMWFLAFVHQQMMK